MWIGDRLVFQGDRFDVLLGDRNEAADGEFVGLFASHPDADGVLSLLTFDGEGHPVEPRDAAV